MAAGAASSWPSPPTANGASRARTSAARPLRQQGHARPVPATTRRSLRAAPDEALTAAEQVRRMAYSPDEAAIALGISRDLVDELVRAGRLRSVKAGHRRLIGIRQIEAFLAGESTDPAVSA